MVRQGSILVLAVAVVLVLATAQAPAVGASFTFGSNNDGDGGFTTDKQNGSWSVEPEALQFEHAYGSPANASALKQLSVDTTPGNTYEVSLETTVVNNGNGNSNRYGVVLFGDDTSCTSTVPVTVIFSYNHYDNPASRSLRIRTGGIHGTSQADVGWTGLGGHDADGVTYTLTGTIAYVGTDIELAFQVTDGTTTSDTVTYSVPAASYTGEYLGIGSRAEDLARFDHKSFSLVLQQSTVIPEPLTACAVLGGLLGIGGYLRRRRMRLS
jgi:hypothetical protein